MNPLMIEALATSRVQEIHSDVARLRGPGLAQSRPASAAAPATGLRSRVGYALVEAGLRLLAADGPLPRA